MLSDGQSKKVAKYRKMAKKNVFFRYLAAGLLISNIIVTKFFSFHKRRIVALGQLCLITLVFLSNTSFAPPSFAYASVNTPMEENKDMIAEGAIYEETKLLEEVSGEPFLPTAEEVANLDDLMETGKDVPAETANLLRGNEQADLTETSEGRSKDVIFDKDDWKLLLVNKQHTIPEDYEFTLGTIKGDMRCDERIIEPLTQMFAGAKADGINLVVRSPYRDMARQEYLFERKVKSYQSTGMSYMDAYKKASVTVTVPGASEHQIGMAFDITSDTYYALDTNFAETEAGKWLKEHSWEYGFILRYPLGKEEITGIQFEPWHFRYVGVEAAEIIMSQNITLEEFIESL